MLNANMLATGSLNRGVIDIGPFRLMLTPDSHVIWANFAVPTGRGYTTQHVSRMIETFRERSRTPRLEVLVDLWPDLPGLLEGLGFQEERRMPIMICERDAFIEPDLGNAESLGPEGELAEAWRVEKAAFGDPDDVDESRLERRRVKMRSGNLMIGVAREAGAIASSALLMIEGDVAELAGVGTLPDHRGKRLAGKASAVTMARFFGNGGSLVWLSAADESAFSAYARLGFEPVGHQVNYSVPA